MDLPEQRIPQTAPCFGCETTRDVVRNPSAPSETNLKRLLFLLISEGFSACQWREMLYFDLNQSVSGDESNVFSLTPALCLMWLTLPAHKTLTPV